jgi:uncharacterized protein (DUF488 family)
MVIGKKDIDYEKLRMSLGNSTSIVQYAIDMVPRCIRHVEPIVFNQRYYVALMLRELNSIPYETRKQRCEDLLKGISISGVINNIVDFEDILLCVDMDQLIQFLFKE